MPTQAWSLLSPWAVVTNDEEVRHLLQFALADLVTAGKTNFGTLLYSLDGKMYSSEIPTATDAKTYTVYYKVEGSDNWNAFEARSVARRMPEVLTTRSNLAILALHA